jgi:gamma-glutamyltranspeptidase/glutathione hydrolase
MPSDVVDGLRQLGHAVTVMPQDSLDFGSAQAIALISADASGGYIAGSDHRRDGIAAGF